MKILIVDDELSTHEQVKACFSADDAEIRSAYSVAEARPLLDDFAPDVCLLDLMMPGESGKVLCRELKERWSDIGVLIISSLGSRSERVVLLEMGADDYIVKPFDDAELRARSRAVARRVGQGTVPSLDISADFGQFDPIKRVLRRKDGQMVSLTTSETEVLRFMLGAPNMVLTRADIMAVARLRTMQCGHDRSVDNLVKRLRQKVEIDRSEPRFIQTVWGRGYLFWPGD